MTTTSQHGGLPPCRGRRHDTARGVPAVVPDRRVCAGCHELAENALVDLFELLERCAVTVAVEDDGTSRRALVGVHADVLGTLATWCGVVTAGRGVAGPDELCVRVLTSFLALHFDWLTGLPAAAAFTDELTELAAVVRDVLRPVS